MGFPSSNMWRAPISFDQIRASLGVARWGDVAVAGVPSVHEAEGHLKNWRRTFESAGPVAALFKIFGSP